MSDSPSEESLAAPRPSHRRMWITIAILVAVWLVVMAFRWPIRTRFWAYRFQTTSSDTTRQCYFAKLLATADRSVGATGSLLRSDNPADRRAAVTILDVAGGDNKQALSLLLTAIGDADQEIRDEVSYSIAIQHGATAVPALLPLLHSNKPEIAAGAVVALGRIAHPDATAALIDAARTHPLLMVRAEAIDALGMAGCASAADVIRESVDDKRALPAPPAFDRALRRALNGLLAQPSKADATPEQRALMKTNAQFHEPKTLGEVAKRALQRIAAEESNTVPRTEREGMDNHGGIR